MPFQPAPGVAKVEIRFLNNGQQTENVIHVQKESGPLSQADLVQIAGIVQLQVSTNWMNKLHTSIVFTEVEVTDLGVEDGNQFTLATVPAQSGGVGGYRLPNEVSVAVRLKAATGGRNGSGRLFWQGLADGQMISTNFITSATATGLLDALQDLIDALAAVQFIVVILSRYLNNVARPTAIPFGPVTPSLYDTTVDSMRRRKPGQGT